MGINLFNLGSLIDRLDYIDIATRMFKLMANVAVRYPSAFSNWGILGLKLTRPNYNVAISGNEAFDKAAKLIQEYMPNILLSVSSGESELPLLKGRFDNETTNIYVCTGNACKLTVAEPEEAVKQIKDLNGT
jgi:uncharacterized protein YyaL (SSP411 family)